MTGPLRRWARQLFARPAVPKVFPSTGFKIVAPTEKLDEENWEWYESACFYPVRIGEVFRARYQVIGKLGYGSRSTAWLCRDLQKRKYVTVKVCDNDSFSVRRELNAYNHLSTVTASKAGARLIRDLLDSFELEDGANKHQCLVHEPLGMSMEIFRRYAKKKRIDKALLKAFVQHLLLALDYLHTDAKMVHADLQAMNVQLRINDESILTFFEEGEMTRPSARKTVGDRVIYETRGLRPDMHPGRPVLCDFGEARFGAESYTGEVQPLLYRAPEVILCMPWSCSVDIWNLAALMWHMFEGQPLFNAQDENMEDSTLHHVAEMVALLGNPPLDYLRRSPTSLEYFDQSGRWCGDVPVPQISLEESEGLLDGEEKVMFLNFVRKMLRWVPEERQTAGQLLEDPWLQDMPVK